MSRPWNKNSVTSYKKYGINTSSRSELESKIYMLAFVHRNRKFHAASRKSSLKSQECGKEREQKRDEGKRKGRRVFHTQEGSPEEDYAQM